MTIEVDDSAAWRGYGSDFCIQETFLFHCLILAFICLNPKPIINYSTW